MKTDNLLIEALRKNSRLKISRIARLQHIPSTTLYFTLNKLEKSIIKRHVTLIDFEKHGYKRHILIIYTTSSEIINKIRNLKFINNMFRTGENIILDCVFNSNNEHLKFLNKLSEKRIKYSSHPVFDVKKQEEMKI